MDETVVYSAPGYYYALAYGLAAMVYIWQNPPRWQDWRRWSFPVLGAGAAFALSLLIDTGLPIFFIPSLVGILGVVALTIWGCCAIPWRNVVYFTLRAFVLGEFSASLQWQLFCYCAPFVKLQAVRWLDVGFLVLVHGVLFAIVFLLERRFRKMNETLQITNKTLLQTVLIALGIYLFSNISNIDINTPFSSQLPSEILMIRTLVDLGGILIFYTYHMQMQEVSARLEIEMLQRMMETQYANYQISEQSMALVHQKYHDLKHQIAYLREELSNEEKLSYLDEMEQQIKSFEAHSNTGNRILDTILSAKLLQCQNQKITMTCVVDGASLNFMDAMDLSALFGNALDNAVESAMQLPQEEQRLIHVTVQVKRGFVVIVVGNSCTGQVQFSDGLPRTSKQDSRYHGFGTKSILAIARKYGGTASFRSEDGWFELKVVLPAAKD